VEDSPGVKRLDASTCFFHHVESVCHWQGLTLEVVSDAPRRQILHPDHWDARLNVSRVNSDHVIVFRVEHHSGFGEHEARGKASSVEIFGRTLTAETGVAFEPHLPKEATSQTGNAVIRQRLHREECNRRHDGFLS